MTWYAILAGWTTLALVATVSPGPDTALVIAHAARGGQSRGVSAALGIAVGNLWYAALFGFGLMTLLTAQPTLHLIAKLGGAVYLAWIGFKMLRTAIRGGEHGNVSTTGRSPFLQGLFSNILNPKIALFFLAAIPQFAGAGPDAPMIGVTLILINGLINAMWLTTVAAGVGRAGTRFQGSQFMRWLEGVIGVALMSLGARVATSWNR